ncbi:hypothetical protein [Stappia sp. ICDLI1TA098]
MNSFTPVASTSETVYTLCVKPDFPAKAGAAFLAALADNPGKYTYGNDGIPRYTFGEPWLLSGLDLIVILLGLYALRRCSSWPRSPTRIRKASARDAWKAWRRRNAATTPTTPPRWAPP